ncbi:MAG: hypothetical protein ABEJ76_00465, partial [Halanaeroarchaeum sp.]
MGGIGLVAGTNVTSGGGAGGDVAYPGQTVRVMNMTVASDDVELYRSTMYGGNVERFGDLSNYGYINDQTADSNFKVGDDLLKLTSNKVNLGSEFDGYTFNDSIVFLDDVTDVPNGISNEYDHMDDIYSVIQVKGNPYISPSGTTYSTFQKQTIYLTVQNTEVSKYTDKFPILSEGGTMGTISNVVHSGSAGSLSDVSKALEHYQDQSGAGNYDPLPNRSFGEPIYVSGDDGQINAGDKRFTKVIINSGPDDSNVRSIDLFYSTKSQVKSQEEDSGSPLENYIQTPTVNEIDPDGAKNSPVGEFGPEDQIVVDTSRDGYFDAKQDIILRGSPTDGDPYTTPNVNGQWEQGSDVYGIDLVVFDIDNDGPGPSSDLVIQDGDVMINNPSNYNNVQTPLKYWDRNNNGIFSSTESVYFDFNDDSIIDSSDFRLTGFKFEYLNGSTVKSGDLDVGSSVTGFSSSVKLIDDDQDSEFDYSEPLIESFDDNLGTDDVVLISGKISRSINHFDTQKDRLELHYSNDNYHDYDPIIALKNEYPTSSRSYNTNDIGFDSSLSVSKFSSSESDLTIYASTSEGFQDGDSIIKIHRFVQTSGDLIDLSSNDPFQINEIGNDLRYYSDTDRYTDNSPIVRELDSKKGSIFGDRVQTVTVHNDGSLA